MNATHVQRLASLGALLVLFTGLPFGNGQEGREISDKDWPAFVADKRLESKPREDALQTLLKARANEALVELRLCYANLIRGRGTLNQFCESAEQLLRSRLELANVHEERLAALERYTEFLEGAAKLMEDQFEVGRAPGSEVHRVRYARCDAEIQLLRAKREKEPMFKGAFAADGQEIGGITEKDWPAFVANKHLESNPQEDVLQKLLKARANEVLEELRMRYANLIRGAGTMDLVCDAAQRLVRSHLELASAHEERMTALEQYLEFLKAAEEILQGRFQRGQAPGEDFHRVRYFRMDAEAQRLRAKGEKEQPRKK